MNKLFLPETNVLEYPSAIHKEKTFREALKELIGDPLTPFHLRIQLWMLLFGSGSWENKLWDLLTVSKSHWQLRERAWGYLQHLKKSAIQEVRDAAVALVARLETAENSIPETQGSLMASIEEKKDGCPPS